MNWGPRGQRCSVLCGGGLGLQALLEQGFSCSIRVRSSSVLPGRRALWELGGCLGKLQGLSHLSLEQSGPWCIAVKSSCPGSGAFTLGSLTECSVFAH